MFNRREIKQGFNKILNIKEIEQRFNYILNTKEMKLRFYHTLNIRGKGIDDPLSALFFYMSTIFLEREISFHSNFSSSLCYKWPSLKHDGARLAVQRVIPTYIGYCQHHLRCHLQRTQQPSENSRCRQRDCLRYRTCGQTTSWEQNLADSKTCWLCSPCPCPVSLSWIHLDEWKEIR